MDSAPVVLALLAVVGLLVSFVVAGPL